MYFLLVEGSKSPPGKVLAVGRGEYDYIWSISVRRDEKEHVNWRCRVLSVLEGVLYIYSWRRLYSLSVAENMCVHL
jgi:hypothetical protein